MAEPEHRKTLTNALNRYQNGLTRMQSLEDRKTYPAEDKQTVLDVLIARDVIQSCLKTIDYNDPDETTWFVQKDGVLKSLDKWLKNSAGLVNDVVDLPQWKQQCGGDPDAWWWNLEPPATGWDKYDWLWNSITLIVLGLSASFIISIIKALSMGNLTVAATFSAIAQLGGVAVISQGTLTEKGRNRVTYILRSVKIPSKFQSEVMFGLALILLSCTWVSHTWLADHYGEKGKTYYEVGNLSDAQQAYLKGIEIEPTNTAYNSELGRIFESIGLVDKALDQYYFSVQSGEITGINNLGRLLINRVHPVTRKTDLKLAQSLLMLGLQRAEGDQNNNVNMNYQLNRNLGWAFLEDGNYNEAEKYLKKAIHIDEEIKEDQIGAGMGYCFLARVYEELSQVSGGSKKSQNEQYREKAAYNWKKCVECGRPETVLEYKWFMSVNKVDLAYYVDTSKIVSGLKRNANEQRAVYDDYLAMVNGEMKP